MKLHEALECIYAAPEHWFRPRSWKGSGQAFRVKNGQVMRVPSLKGGIFGITADATLLAGEWEVLDPSRVLMEAN